MFILGLFSFAFVYDALERWREEGREEVCRCPQREYCLVFVAAGRTKAAYAGIVPALLRLLADMSHIRKDTPADNKLMEDIASALAAVATVGMCAFFRMMNARPHP